MWKNLVIIFFQVKPLIWVEAQVGRHSMSCMEIMLKARSQFKERSYGTCTLCKNLCMEYMLRGEFRLPSITSEEAVPERKAPIQVKFDTVFHCFRIQAITLNGMRII